MAFKDSKTKKQPAGKSVEQTNKVLQLKIKQKTFSAVGGKPLPAGKWNAAQERETFCVDCGAVCEIQGDTYFVCSRNSDHPRYFVSLIEEKGITNPKMVRVE